MTATVEATLYDDTEVATTAELQAAKPGTVLVTEFGEGRAWIKAGTSSWVSIRSRRKVSQPRPAHWFALKAPVIVWEPPTTHDIGPVEDEHFFDEEQRLKLAMVGRRISRIIAQAAGPTYHIPLDVRTRITAAILAGGVSDAS